MDPSNKIKPYPGRYGFVELDSHIFELLKGLTIVKFLSLSICTFKMVEQLVFCYDVPSIPTFSNLKKLELDVSSKLDREYLGMFLSYTPNLEFLTLINNKVCSSINVHPNRKYRWTLPVVPDCLIFHLKEIIVEGLNQDDEVQDIKHMLQLSQL